MTEEPSTNPGVYTRIEQRLERIEDKLDARMDVLDTKVDGLNSRQDRLEGKLEGTVGMIRWLGPVGVAAILFGLMTMYGLLPRVGL